MVKNFVMANDKSGLVSMWNNSYCDKVKKYQPYSLSNEISKIEKYFSLGKSYIYVINFHNMQLDHVGGVPHKILGLNLDDFTLINLLDRFSYSEYENVESKEKLIADFRLKNFKDGELAYYKTIHYLEALDRNKNKKLILHQSMPLTTNEDGTIQHVVGIHTDVSHLNIVKDETVSFIHTRGGASFKNVDPAQGFLSVDHEKSLNGDWSKDLTSREIQICRLLSEGYSSRDISNQLKITLNTVNTHRRKILKKTNCYNSAELINKFFTHNF